MAEKATNGRKVLIAVDGSEHSDRAFECEYRVKIHRKKIFSFDLKTVGSATGHTSQFVRDCLNACFIESINMVKYVFSIKHYLARPYNARMLRVAYTRSLGMWNWTKSFMLDQKLYLVGVAIFGLSIFIVDFTPPGGLFFSSTFKGRLNREGEGGLFVDIRGRASGSRALYCFF